MKVARQSALRAACASNLRQVGILLHAYASFNDGELSATYGPSASGLRPMAWYGFAVCDHGNGSKGLLLLVNRPKGLAAGAFAPDANVFICPSELGPGPRDPNDFFQTRGPPDTFISTRKASSYAYCYVPAGGDSYKWWNFDPENVGTGVGERSGMPQWDRGAMAGFERHNVNQRNPASTAVMCEPNIFHILGAPWGRFADPHGRGGCVLYLDGHVITGISKEVDLSDPSRQDYRGLMSNLTILDHLGSER